jgi:glycine/D-amino acid oxidase-like deaminating enzyme
VIALEELPDMRDGRRRGQDSFWAAGCVGRHPALADATQVPYWLDHPDVVTDPAPPLAGSTRADLVVVGGGYTGLWTALLAKDRRPALDVVVLEADRVGQAASGRNGGFCSASLTHGLGNGLDRFRDELPTLERIGRENLDAIEGALSRYDIDCHWERTGDLSVATQPWQADELAELAPVARQHGANVDLLDQTAVRAEVASPTYLAGLWIHGDLAIVDPARLAVGLRAGSRSVHVTARWQRRTRRSRRTRSGRCCAGCAGTPSRSTTTS